MPEDEFDFLEMLDEDNKGVENISDTPNISDPVRDVVSDRGELSVSEEILEIHEDGAVTPYKKLEDPKAECLRQITNILSEHGGLESNIPINHNYWKLVGKYRVMR